MIRLGLVTLLIASSSAHAADFDAHSAERFAKLALACVHKEYPNKISHSMTSDKDVAPPRLLTPAFYGCYDWHSSVHGHWLLARLTRTFPDAPFAADARAALKESLTPEHIAQEAAYLRGEGRASFERPYGLAWLLQLAAELREWDPELSATLHPLEEAAVDRLKAWLPKLSHPIRSGEHSQTAFALGLIYDYGRDPLVASKIREFYLHDRNCPISYEPSGEDFLSPCLAEADVMRRVLPPKEFAKWFDAFLPKLSIRPEVVTDPSDPRLAHLDGLNLSRAWMLEGIVSALPRSSPRRAALTAVAKAHRDAGLASVTGEHYEGGHWLGSFAVYLTTKRGLARSAVVPTAGADASRVRRGGTPPGQPARRRRSETVEHFHDRRSAANDRGFAVEEILSRSRAPRLWFWDAVVFRATSRPRP